MGINVQVVWEKFCRYWDVEPRYAPMAEGRLQLNAEEALKLVDENTIGVVAILGSTFDGSYEPVKEIADALDALAGVRRPGHPGARRRCLRRLRRAVHRPGSRSGTSGCRGCARSTPRVTSTAWSTRVSGWVVWRTPEDLPEDLVFHVNYLGGDMPTFALNFSRPGAQVVAQYYNFIRLGRRGIPGDPAGVP